MIQSFGGASVDMNRDLAGCETQAVAMSACSKTMANMADQVAIGTWALFSMSVLLPARRGARCSFASACSLLIQPLLQSLQTTRRPRDLKSPGLLSFPPFVDAVSTSLVSRSTRDWTSMWMLPCFSWMYWRIHLANRCSFDMSPPPQKMHFCGGFGTRLIFAASATSASSLG